MKEAGIKLICAMVAMSLLGLGLTGCGDHKERKKLKQYVQQVKGRQGLPVEPIPEYQPPNKHKYALLGSRSPFHPITNKVGANGPDKKREKQPLEAFPLDSLRMVGILRRNKELWALISTPDGGIYRISHGEYMGQHFGKVKTITANDVKLEETVFVDGHWVKQPASLSLASGEEDTK
jgi:type IV pilus assembly protein PilP